MNKAYRGMGTTKLALDKEFHSLMPIKPTKVWLETPSMNTFRHFEFVYPDWGYDEDWDWPFEDYYVDMRTGQIRYLRCLR